MNINIFGFDENGNVVIFYEFVELLLNTTSISCKCELRGIFIVFGVYVQVFMFMYSGGGGFFRFFNFWYFIVDNVIMQDSYYQGGVINIVKWFLIFDINDFG